MLIARFVLTIALASLTVLAAGVASAQEYPNKLIRIMASAPGGSTDFAGRLIAAGISGPLGQSVIVENRPSIGAIEIAAKAPPDGYTLLVGGGTLWILPLLQSTSWDVMRDFAPISLISREVNVVAVHPSMPVKSIKELIALAKAKPGVLNYGVAAAGSSTHLAAELFKSMAGVDIVIVAYKGTAPAITALLSGELHLTIVDAGLVKPHMKSGKLKALAVTSATPSALAPELPTAAASGLPGYEATSTTTIVAPAKTPAAIINRLNQEIVRFVNRADIKEQFLTAGSEIVASSPEQFATTLKSDIAKWSKVIQAAGIKN